jgi:hypothetical protein
MYDENSIIFKNTSQDLELSIKGTASILSVEDHILAKKSVHS